MRVQPWGVYLIPPLAGCTHPLRGIHTQSLMPINVAQCRSMLWWVRSLNCAHGLRTYGRVAKLAQRGTARHMVRFAPRTGIPTRPTNVRTYTTPSFISHKVRSFFIRVGMYVQSSRRPYAVYSAYDVVLLALYTMHGHPIPLLPEDACCTLLLYNRPHNARQMR